ncbi:MAG TPA: hypothetical protein IAB55_06715 [Candidatus Merdivicinus faecavium]|nr:hypothetical protein [Candidatus Merdivicinus faecavium]
MLLYTILGAEQIFPSDPPQTELKMVAGRLCECVREGERLRVSRLISTDPADFLNPALSPGADAARGDAAGQIL